MSKVQISTWVPNIEYRQLKSILALKGKSFSSFITDKIVEEIKFNQKEGENK